MRTVQIKVFPFSELSKAAQDKALESLHDLNTHFDWFDSTYEDSTEIAKLLGIEIDQIYFSGFSNQGDGACFEGSYRAVKNAYKAIKAYAPKDETLHAIARELDAIQKANRHTIEARTAHSGHYYHEYCTIINVTNDTGEYSEAFNAETEREVEAILRRFMKWIYRQLESEHDYLTSREAIIEGIEANEYEFLESGKMAGACIAS